MPTLFEIERELEQAREKQREAARKNSPQLPKLDAKVGRLMKKRQDKLKDALF